MAIARMRTVVLVPEGGWRLAFQRADDDTFRVYLDPAGHPFCLCWD